MTPEPKIIGHPLPFLNNWVGTIKRAFWVIPEIMAGSAVALIGMGLATIGCINYVRNDGDNREYKSTYTIIRADDPRARHLKNPVYTQYKC